MVLYLTIKPWNCTQNRYIDCGHELGFLGKFLTYLQKKSRTCNRIGLRQMKQFLKNKCLGYLARWQEINSCHTRGESKLQNMGTSGTTEWTDVLHNLKNRYFLGNLNHDKNSGPISCTHQCFSIPQGREGDVF